MHAGGALMDFDAEGHIRVTPHEVEDELIHAPFLINNVLVPGTPHIFRTLRGFSEFCDWLSDQLHIHPRNLVIRGSTKLGFSLHPDKLWVSVSPESDIDVAIVDTDYYHVIDRDVRHMESRSRTGNHVPGDSERRAANRQRFRASYCYRYFDLPDIPVVRQQQAALKAIPVQLVDRPRIVNAFVFRDWWCLFDKYSEELRQLRDGLREETLPHGPQQPRLIEEAIPRDDLQ